MRKYSILFFTLARYLIVIPYFLAIFLSVDLQRYEIAFSALLLVLATLISFSQTCFSYEAAIKDSALKESLLMAGKKFFISSLWLGVGTVILFVYLVFLENVFTEQWYMYVIKYIFLVLAFGNFIFFSINLNSALKKAEDILF